MCINKQIINNALKFYEIEDEEYLNRCYKCVEFLNNNEDIYQKVKDIYSILYKDNENKVKDLWKIKNIEELFGKNCDPYITNILLLSGYKIHYANMKKHDFDEKQSKIHKIRVKETLTKDVYERKYDGIRISQMLWGAYFINIRLIEVGRLQYEIETKNPITYENKECIKIHIPKGEKLSSEIVIQSLKESKYLIKKYFKIENYEYFCESWLLSKQIQELLEENSNITKFYKMFNVIEGKECIDDILNFVYNIRECDNYNSLQENTLLQKKLKSMLIDGKTIKTGIGILK